jgi:hypothetical protein
MIQEIGEVDKEEIKKVMVMMMIIMIVVPEALIPEKDLVA